MNEALNDLSSKDDPWKRALYIVLFLFINSLLKGVVLITALAQFLHVVIKGELNQYISEFSQGLSNYSYNIARYVTFLTDEKPFPFSAWDNEKL